MDVHPSPPIRPPLDPEFLPASVFNRDYRRDAEASGRSKGLKLVMVRPNGRRSVFEARVIEGDDRTPIYCERLLKSLLWQRGAGCVLVAGLPAIATNLAKVYSRHGTRAFDWEFLGRRVYLGDLLIQRIEYDQAPEPDEVATGIGRHWDGCRIGFDLGGSDRKCAAVIDGNVVYSEEVGWDPYFQSDPEYHFQGIQDSLKRAAGHLPRVDAIGGSAAGVYIDNEVRAASLFRRVPDDLFERRVRRMFFDVQRAWGGVPFVVVNDGEVAALAASMSLECNSVLGISLGTSLAAGYVNSEGGITDWLNELAFVPVDCRPGAPVDEWSGDAGVGVQYLSQQAVARLCPAAGISLSDTAPLAERLLAVQALMADHDPRAQEVFATIGVYLGYSLAHYAAFLDVRRVVLMGRVTSGEGGVVLLENARAVLAAEFPELGIEVSLADEKSRRHGQAVAAASLPAI